MKGGQEFGVQNGTLEMLQMTTEFTFFLSSKSNPMNRCRIVAEMESKELWDVLS